MDKTDYGNCFVVRFNFIKNLFFFMKFHKNLTVKK